MGNFLREAVELDDIIVFKFSALFLKLFDLGQVLARFTLLDHRVKSGYLTFSVKDSATEVLFGVGHVLHLVEHLLQSSLIFLIV